MRFIALLSTLFLLGACSSTIVVNNCPAWLEVGTIDIIHDTEETQRWMYRFERNRQDNCK